MSKFEVLLLQPNVSGCGSSGIDKEYTEKALRDSVDSLTGKPVQLGEPAFLEADSVVGEVVDAEYVEGEGVQCTVSVEDDRVATLLEGGITSLAPKLFHETLEECEEKQTINEIEFDAIFTTDTPTEQVGDTNSV